MDEQRFERQLRLEEEYHGQGYSKVIHQDQQNKERSYGSHTAIGNLVRQELVGYVGEYLKAEKKRIDSGATGPGFSHISEAFEVIDELGLKVDWNRISHIGVSTLLDFLFFHRESASTVNLKIGQRIDDDLMFRFYKRADDKLFKYVERYFLRHEAGYSQKVKSTKCLYNKAADELDGKGSKGDGEYLRYKGWDSGKKHNSRRVGAWIVDSIQTVFTALVGTPLLVYVKIPSKGKHLTKAYALHEDLRDLEHNAQIKKGYQANYKDNPMVCPPMDWSLTRPGGFLSNSATRRYDLVRRGIPTVPSQEAIDALNRIQQTAWRINPFVYEQLAYFYQRGESINSTDPFKPYLAPEEYDVPKLPPQLAELPDVESATNDYERFQLEKLHEERAAAVKEIHAWHDREASRRRNARNHQLVYGAATRFLKEDRIWMPWSFDFRTRMYPICILNPQQGNHVNALLMFADGYRFRAEDGEVIDEKAEEWLAIHLATTKGFSKETFEGRVSWVKANLKEVSLVATDPLGRGRHYWTEEADEPWVYLAACKEYYDCFIAKTKNETHLQCGIDATASGLQILGALMGDESACKLVNVVATSKPSDLYQAIIDKTIKLIKDDRPRRRGIPLDQLSRSVAKAPTMTLAYGSTEWRRRNQVLDACNGKRGLDLGLKYEKIAYIAKKLDEAIALVLPGVTTTLNWLCQSALESMKRDKTKLMVSWLTPIGSVINQAYFIPKLVRVRTIALGMTKYSQPEYSEPSDKPDLNKVESSTAANFVHSMDATIIQFTANSVTFPMSATHDCVYGRAGRDMEQLAKEVREGFIRVIEADPIKDFAEMNGIEDLFETIATQRNDEFKVNRVRRSRYFFC
jgi:DNA-dependent RNA polymerase